MRKLDLKRGISKAIVLLSLAAGLSTLSISSYSVKAQEVAVLESVAIDAKTKQAISNAMQDLFDKGMFFSYGQNIKVPNKKGSTSDFKRTEKKNLEKDVVEKTYTLADGTEIRKKVMGKPSFCFNIFKAKKNTAFEGVDSCFLCVKRKSDGKVIFNKLGVFKPLKDSYFYKNMNEEKKISVEKALHDKSFVENDCNTRIGFYSATFSSSFELAEGEAKAGVDPNQVSAELFKENGKYVNGEYIAEFHKDVNGNTGDLIASFEFNF